MEIWNSSKSSALYGIENWGEGYFAINSAGNVVVRPNRGEAEIDISVLVESLVQRGVHVPVLLRFDGIIRDRVQRISQAFAKAIEESGYAGKYRGVFPIKVNQQRHVVDCVRLAGRESQLGLEVGSKPELIAVLAMHDTPDALLLCNGYKDKEYIELALLSRRLGRRAIIIIEQVSEVEQILNISQQLGIDAEVGLRMKPVTRGSGRWEGSAGDQAKFGLSTSEIMFAIEAFKKQGRSDWIKLLHFHVGSQITSIAAIKRVLKEATRMYTEIATLCPSLAFFDVGGGLAVDYDGSKTNFDSSMNYSLEEYARDVVYAIMEACTEAKIATPDIVTEAGRAITAQHAILIAEVVDVAPALDVVSTVGAPPTAHPILKDLEEMHNNVNLKNLQETLHDILGQREELLSRFIQGDITLTERAWADTTFWHAIAKIENLSRGLKYMPEDLEGISDWLKDTYFCNFSVFQSMPDSWAIDQLFPILPIRRLTEEPTRRAILADMTCDSDGKIDRFIDLKDVKRYLNLHPMKNGVPYYIGMFLVGAYQEILGDLHNLFGDTNAVHVDMDDEGNPVLTHVVEGDCVREALGYVQYEPQDLMERLRVSIERSLKEGTLTNEDSAKLQKRYREALEGYTYLSVES
jgi:arginine decarboxylase